MTGQAAPLKFVEPRPFADPEAAARELLRLVRERMADGTPYGYTGKTNSDFLYKLGGTVAEYTAGRDFGIAHGWFEIERSGTRIIPLPDAPF